MKIGGDVPHQGRHAGARSMEPAATPQRATAVFAGIAQLLAALRERKREHGAVRSAVHSGFAPMGEAGPSGAAMQGLAQALAHHYGADAEGWADLKRCLPLPVADASPSCAEIRLYLDTEFTALPGPDLSGDPDLVSVALTTGDRFVYGVNRDVDLRRASDYVLHGDPAKGEAGILDLSTQSGEVPESRAGLRLRVQTWLESFPPGARLVVHYDFPTDWHLLCTLLGGDGRSGHTLQLPGVVVTGQKLTVFDAKAEDLRRFREYNDDPSLGLVRHHALHDARALAYAHAVRAQRLAVALGERHVFQPVAPCPVPHRLLCQLEAFIANTERDPEALARLVHGVEDQLAHHARRAAPAPAQPHRFTYS